MVRGKVGVTRVVRDKIGSQGLIRGKVGVTRVGRRQSKALKGWSEAKCGSQRCRVRG